MLLKQYPYERVSGPIFEYAGIVIPDLLEALQVHLHIILRYKLEQAGIRFVDENYAWYNEYISRLFRMGLCTVWSTSWGARQIYQNC